MESRIVSDLNLYEEYPTQFDVTAFESYLTTIRDASRTSRSVCNDIKYFFTYKQYKQESPTNIILNRKNVREYIGHLKNVKGLQGTTIAEKMTRLRTAIDYLTEEDDSIKVNAKVEAMKRFLSSYRKVFSGIIAQQRIDCASKSTIQVHKPCIFLYAYLTGCFILYQLFTSMLQYLSVHHLHSNLEVFSYQMW